MSDYSSGIIITGDASGGIRAINLTRNELDQLNTTQRRTARQSSAMAKSVSRSMSDGAASLAKWTAGLASAGAALSSLAIGQSISEINEMQVMATSMDMSTQSLSEWTYAASTMNISGEKIADMMKDWAERMGDLNTTAGGPAKGLLDHMHFSAKKLAAMSPDKQILAIGEALDRIDNRADQSFFLETMASEAHRLMPLLENNATLLKKLIAESRVLGISISDIDSAKIAEAASAMSRVGGVMKGAANQASVALAPVLTGISDVLVQNAVDAGGFKKTFENMIDGAVTGIGFFLDAGLQLQIWSKQAQVSLLMVAQANTYSMAAMAETTATVLNQVFAPFQKTIAWIIEKLTFLVELGAKIGGPFAENFRDAADWLKGASAGVEKFTVTGGDIIALNERMQQSIVASSKELEVLVNQGAPSEKIQAWLQRVRAESDAAAVSQENLQISGNKTGNELAQGGKTAAEYAEAMSKAADNIDDFIAKAAEGSVSTKDYNKAIADAAVYLDGTAYGVRKYNDELERIDNAKLSNWFAGFKAKVDPASVAQERFNTTLQNLSKLFPEGSAELAKYVALAKKELQDGLIPEVDEKQSLLDMVFDINATDLEKELKPLTEQLDTLREALKMEDEGSELGKGIKEGIKTLESDITQVKFDHVIDNAKEGLQSFQSMAKAGSESYQAIGIAVQALSAIQAVNAVVKQLSEGDPYTAFARAAAAAAAVASLGFSIGGFGGSDSGPSMPSEQIGFETAKTDNESITNRLDQQIELLEAIERNGSASALNVDLAATEYQGALFEWVEDVFDKSRMGFVDAMFDASSESWAAIEEHYKSLEIENPYELIGDQIRINAEQFYSDADSLIAVIQNISQMSQDDEFNYSGPLGQEIADEYGYGDDAHEAFRAAMRSSFTELQGYLNDWAVTSIESLTDLSDASESMKESFDAITGSTHYATEELDEAYAVFNRISGGDYKGYLEENIDAIARAEGWLEQLTGSYDEHGNQLTNFQLILSKDVDLFEDQAAAVEQFNEVLGDTFEGGAEEALNFISNIELVAESLQKTQELEDQILELTDSEEYLIVMRQRELDALTDSQKALQKQVWALEDQAEAQAALLSITDLISDSLSPLSATEKTLVDANRAMVALGMTGLTYKDVLISIEDYNTDDLISLADALGMSFKDIQTMIKDIIDGNETITDGGSTGVQSVEAAQTALSVAEADVWQFADVINESFGGVIPTVEAFNDAFGNLGTDKLVEIDDAYGSLVDSLFGGIENLPGSKNALEEAYFGQFDSLNEDQLIDQVDKDIGEIYKRLFGRLPDLEGLDWWRDEVEAPGGWSLEELETELKTHPEAQGYKDFNGLLGLFDEYQADQAVAGFDVGAMADSLAVLDTAKGTLQSAIANVPADVAETLNNAGADFNKSIQDQIDGFGLEGEALELFDLGIWKDDLIEQAKAVGGDVNLIDELYGKRRVEIVDKYAQEASDTLQKTFDFDKGIQDQIDSFDLEGEALELFDLDIWKEGLIDQAEAVGGDVNLIEELYGKKRVAIVKQYAQEAADELIETSGLDGYLQGVYDYVNDQSQLIEDNYQDQMAVLEQWKDVAEDLRDYVDQIKLSELSPYDPGEKLQLAGDQLAALMVKAEAGDLEAAGKLQGAASTYLENADSYYGRSPAYTALFNEVTGSLDQLGIDVLAANGESELERLDKERNDKLQAIKDYAQTEKLWAENQALALTGIDTALGEWPDKFDTMLSDLAGDIGSAVAGAIPDRSAVDLSGGTGTTSNGIDGSGSSTGTDASGSGGTSGGMSSADASAIIHASMNGSVSTSDYQAAASTLGISSYADLADFIDGSHANGLDSVPFDGYRAELHKNEMVLTADVSDHIRQSMRITGSQQPATDPALIRLVETLVASNQRLEKEVAALRSERSSADNVANKKRDQQIKVSKSAARSNRSKQEIV
jgi:hypothetical protein